MRVVLLCRDANLASIQGWEDANSQNGKADGKQVSFRNILAQTVKCRPKGILTARTILV